MGTVSVIEPLGESRSFQTRHGSRVAIVGGGMLGTALALRYRQAGRIVTVFEASERVERRGHASIASRDRSLLALLSELGLAGEVQWDSPRVNGLRFGALPGGRARIIETLRDRARAIDVDVRLGSPVRAISADGSGFCVTSGIEAGDFEHGEFDQVVLTVPSPVAAELLSDLPERERWALPDVGYVGIINVSFVLKPRPVQASNHRYITHLTRGKDNFALLDPSVLSPGRDDSRRSVVYVTRPLSTNDRLFDADDRHVIEHFARALPGNSNIISARVVRMPHAFAQHRLNSFKVTTSGSASGLSIVNAAHMGGGRHHLERTAALSVNAFRTLCAERIS
jgi:protoporphyrinogen oxidase